MVGVKSFLKRYPGTGPVLWILSIQYFIIQAMVVAAWPYPQYSYRFNTISDLGNTVCGPYGQRLVCSPYHTAMNLSFILLGITQTAGAILIYQSSPKRHGLALGFSCMVLAGVGTLLVGLFPENTISGLHTLGAALPFSVGNLGLIILGLSLAIPMWLRVYTILSGTVALAALAVFLAHPIANLGAGGTERLTAYPQTLWLIVFGLYALRQYTRFRQSTD